jgi:hypothetical protein
MAPVDGSAHRLKVQSLAYYYFTTLELNCFPLCRRQAYT